MEEASFFLGGTVDIEICLGENPPAIRPAMRQAALKAAQRIGDFSRQTDQSNLDILKKMESRLFQLTKRASMNGGA